MKTIHVKVKPKARVSALDQMSDGTWLARIKSPPIDGKANAELLLLVARHFAVRKAQVSIKSGASGRLKLVQIKDSLIWLHKFRFPRPNAPSKAAATAGPLALHSGRRSHRGFG